MRKDLFFDTIVVGADFSEHSREVFRNALLLSREWDVHIVLAHVVEPVSAVGTEAIPIAEPIVLEKRQMEESLKRFYRITPRLEKRVKTIVDYGQPAEDLIRIAKRYRKPLILIGHTRKGPFSRLALGSVSKSLAVKSPVPVWIQ